MNADSHYRNHHRTFGITVLTRLLSMLLQLFRFACFAVLACIEPFVVAALTFLALALFGAAGFYALAATPGVPIATFLLTGAGCAIGAAAYSVIVQRLR